jgi:hypothetical protein
MPGAVPSPATPPGILGATAPARDADDRSAAPLIEGYEIDCLLGSGGCGTVWRARQAGALERTVAIKVLRKDVSSTRLLARFHAERQILAAMDHPGIVQVHAAGIDGEGRPWFAMPYVDGTPLNEAADAMALSVADRVALLDRVAGAIEHAHQRGIIHRDLKPQNVLLPAASGSAELQPRIIDFGVAKAVFGTAAPRSADTVVGQRIGTPGYMSPEQFAGQPVDTRTDVWSLGVLLHELLTGSRPEQLACDSADVWTGDASPKGGFQRASDMAATSAPDRHIDPDLDAIVERCLQEDREERYPSVSQLRDDLARWTRREPVSARMHAPLHEIRLFLRRNRPTAIAVAAAFMVTFGLAVFAFHTADEAKGQAVRAEQALARARLSEEFTNQFLVGNAGLNTAPKDVSLLMRILRSLEPAPDATGSADPLAMATRHAFLGRGYSVLREWNSADPHLDAAFRIFDSQLPEGSERTVDVLIDMVRHRNVVFTDEVIGHARRHLAAARRDLSVAASKVDLLDWHVLLALPGTLDDPAHRAEAIARIRARVARMRKERPTEESTLIAASESILRCAWSGFPELGRADAREILEDFNSGRIRDVGPGLLVALSAGGYAAGVMDDTQFCVDIYERFGDKFVEILGRGHRSTFDIHNNAGFGLAALGRELEGIEVLKRVLPWTVLEYGDSSPHAELVRNNIRFAESRLAARASAEYP